MAGIGATGESSSCLAIISAAATPPPCCSCWLLSGCSGRWRGAPIKPSRASPWRPQRNPGHRDPDTNDERRAGRRQVAQRFAPRQPPPTPQTTNPPPPPPKKKGGPPRGPREGARLFPPPPPFRYPAATAW